MADRETQRLGVFIAELERLMIAFRIVDGKLLWNGDDIALRDQVVNWAKQHAMAPAAPATIPRREQPSAVDMTAIERAIRPAAG